MYKALLMEVSKPVLIEKFVFSLILFYGVSQGSMPIMISLLIFGIIYQSLPFLLKEGFKREYFI